MAASALALAVVAAANPVSLEPTLDAAARPGATLRSARAALAAGDLTRAGPLLFAVAAQHPIVADHAELLWLRALVEAGRYEPAAELADRWVDRETPLAADFFTLGGRAYEALGDVRRSREAYSRALDATDDEARKAEIHVWLARSLEASGEHAAAAREYVTVWSLYPLTEGARAAESALDTLEAGSPGPGLRSGDDQRRRGDAWFRARRNENALAAYETALESGTLTRGQRRRAERQIAHTLFRMRRYTEAAAAYGALPAADEYRIEMARAYARSGQVERGIKELAKVGRRTRSRHAARANLLAGLLAEGEDEIERSRQFFEAASKRGSGTSHAAAAVWRLGWSAFKERRFEEAARYFQRLIGHHEIPDHGRDALTRLRPRYWRARALEVRGDGRAEREFIALATHFPMSYYGWRASQRVVVPRSLEPATPIEPGTPALTELELERPRILLAAGMLAEARAELDRLYPRVDSLIDRLALARLYSDVGDYNRPERLMLGEYNTRLSRRPSLPDVEVWWHAWPAPYDRPFRETAESGITVEPGLVYAVMREESGYLAQVVSVSGARGLLQIMPTTGEKLARDLAIESFSPEDLFDPDVNIRLGSAYLAQLLERFEGRTSAAVASYNAGPEAVSRWIASGPLEDDEWVESIPYDQTRTYVKRVLRSLHAYRVLY